MSAGKFWLHSLDFQLTPSFRCHSRRRCRCRHNIGVVDVDDGGASVGGGGGVSVAVELRARLLDFVALSARGLQAAVDSSLAFCCTSSSPESFISTNAIILQRLVRLNVSNGIVRLVVEQLEIRSSFSTSNRTARRCVATAMTSLKS